MSIFHEKFTLDNRPCRITASFPKKCSCGDCDRDDDYCDIVFTDNNEFKRRVLTKELIDSTDQKDVRDNEVLETPKI